MKLPLTLLLAGILVSCSGQRTIGSVPVVATITVPPDWTVVAKNRYSGGDSGKVGTYVTVALGGQERETQVATPCYEAARLNEPLPESVVGSVGIRVICR